MAANISGGHLNPAVSFSTAVCGFYPLMHTIVYIALQILGLHLGGGGVEFRGFRSVPRMKPSETQKGTLVCA